VIDVVVDFSELSFVLEEEFFDLFEEKLLDLFREVVDLMVKSFFRCRSEERRFTLLRDLPLPDVGVDNELDWSCSVVIVVGGRNFVECCLIDSFIKMSKSDTESDFILLALLL